MEACQAQADTDSPLIPDPQDGCCMEAVVVENILEDTRMELDL